MIGFLRSCLAIVILALPQVVAAEAPLRVINVSGEGRVEAVPDMATIRLGVTHEAREAKEAMDRVSADLRRVLGVLKEAGLDPRDVQTQRFSLNPVWDNRRYDSNQPPRITGFVASNTIVARVRDMAALPVVLDAVIQNGANDFNGLQFGVQEPEPLQDEARRRAVADAMRKAALLAEAAGVTLGPVQSMSEHGGRQAPVMIEAAMSMRADAGAPIAAGEVSLAASVSMVFTILD